LMVGLGLFTVMAAARDMVHRKRGAVFMLIIGSLETALFGIVIPVLRARQRKKELASPALPLGAALSQPETPPTTASPPSGIVRTTSPGLVWQKVASPLGPDREPVEGLRADSTPCTLCGATEGCRGLDAYAKVEFLINYRGSSPHYEGYYRYLASTQVRFCRGCLSEDEVRRAFEREEGSRSLLKKRPIVCGTPPLLVAIPSRAIESTFPRAVLLRGQKSCPVERHTRAVSCSPRPARERLSLLS
jgi:hypothetical protein